MKINLICIDFWINKVKEPTKNGKGFDEETIVVTNA